MRQIIENARIVRARDEVNGSIAIRNGQIEFLEHVDAREGNKIDFEGDYLVPGLVDLHTDSAEHYMQPRAGVQWPSTLAAVLSHDWQILGSGITTVFDALALGDYDSGGARSALLDAIIDGVEAAQASDLLRADHYLHFRCELSDPGLMQMVERHIGNPRLRLLSIMDHTPGQRQWHDLDLYRAFRRKKNARVWSDEEFASYLDQCQQHQARHVPSARKVIGALSKERGLPLASHDDTTIADVEESHGDGIVISEFPTTVEAARHARELGMATVMGAPNIILGGSHSGNVSALDLAKEGLLDVLTSDYVPGSLLHAPFALAAKGFDLAEAIAMVSRNPAQLVGLTDRGHIAPGLRADLLRVRLVDGVPVIRSIWVAGRQIL